MVGSGSTSASASSTRATSSASTGALKSVTYALGIRQKLMPIPGVTEVTVEGVRLSRFALERATRMYARYTPLGQLKGASQRNEKVAGRTGVGGAGVRCGIR